jgi:hypothetical protein
MMRSVVFAANGLGGIIVKRANKSFASLLHMYLFDDPPRQRSEIIDRSDSSHMEPLPWALLVKSGNDTQLGKSWNRSLFMQII